MGVVNQRRCVNLIFTFYLSKYTFVPSSSSNGATGKGCFLIEKAQQHGNVISTVYKIIDYNILLIMDSSAGCNGTTVILISTLVTHKTSCTWIVLEYLYEYTLCHRFKIVNVCYLTPSRAVLPQSAIRNIRLSFTVSFSFWIRVSTKPLHDTC